MNRRYVYCDFETQSAVNLRSVGTKNYLEHPSTRIMSGVFMRDGYLTVWVPKKVLPSHVKIAEIHGVEYRYAATLPVDLIKDRVLVGHNMELFDARVLRTLTTCPEFEIEDTIALARANGYPAGLDGLLRAMGLPGKGDDVAMKVLTQVKVAAGRYVYQAGTSSLWSKLIEYNIQDVKDLEKVHTQLCNLGNLDTDFYTAHLQCNENGFKIDRKKLRQLRLCWQWATSRSGDVISELTNGELDGTSIRSPAKVKAWLIGKGFWLPGNSLSRQNLVDVFNHPERYTSGMGDDDGITVLALLAERQNAVTAVTGKLDRILDEMDDADHVRYSHVVHGAHTGRDSSRGVQIQNFPRGVPIGSPEVYTQLINSEWTPRQIERVEAKTGVKARDILSTLTRNIIVPSDPDNVFIIYDYAQIEARMLAWLAECDTMLGIFADKKKDMYQDMANKLGAGRFMGKQCVLAFGYQMGDERFEITCKAFGIDLKALGLTAKQCKDTYRNSYPEIPRLWKAYETAAMGVVRGGNPVHVGRCQFELFNGWLVVTLPSGRQLRYRDATIEPVESQWGVRDQVRWTNGYGIRRSLYGGILTENIDQAASNDVLRKAMVDCPKASRLLRFRVHDELVIECRKDTAAESLKRIGIVMSKPPKWAKGLPLKVEGMTSEVYTKFPLSTCQKGCYMLGRKV